MKKDVLLLNLPLTDAGIPPAAIAAITPVFKNNGYKVSFIDVNLEIRNGLSTETYNAYYDWCQLTGDLNLQQDSELKDWCQKFVKSLPEISTIAISMFSVYSFRFGVLFLKFLNELKKDTTVIVGGSCMSSNLHASSDYTSVGEYLLKHRLATHVVFGEGEISLDKLLKNISYPGVNKNNPIQIDDLNSLTIPDFSVFDLNKYYNKRLLITASRGCVRQCTFCDIENTWPKFKYRSPENVLNEIIYNKKEYNISRFEFTDSLINGSISNWIKFNELLADAKSKDSDLKDIQYSGQFICREESSHPKHMYELMYHAGATQLTVGIESFSERIRHEMRKKFSNKAIDYHLEQCAYWGIPNVFLMIVGYPGETLNDHQQNINALHRYETYSDMGVIFMIRWGFTMHIYKDTKLFDLRHKLGLQLEDLDIDGFYTWVSSLSPDVDFIERVRRRVELHEISFSLGYSQPNTYNELTSLKNLLYKYSNQKVKSLTIHKL